MTGGHDGAPAFDRLLRVVFSPVAMEYLHASPCAECAPAVARMEARGETPENGTEGMHVACIRAWARARAEVAR